MQPQKFLDSPIAFARLADHSLQRRRLTVVTNMHSHAAETVLICEDDANLRTLVRLALGNGFRYVEAADGPSALDELEKGRPDLIVLDLMLPGMNGLDLLDQIRNSDGGETIPVIVISAWDSDEDAVTAGADRFIAKPFDPEQLRATAGELLERNGKAD
jgi:DNA-binding response OmpR family regulator